MIKKSYLWFLFVFSLFFVISCTKKEINNTMKELNINNSLLALYNNNMEEPDYGEIEIVHGDILRFESEEHFRQVYQSLLSQCESWTDVFVGQYGALEEDSLNIIADSLGFDEYLPLLIFEDYYSFNNNLRAVCLDLENEWMAAGEHTTPPSDPIVSCPIEQTLFSQYYEVCVGDTVYQLRKNGVQVLIPLDSILYIDNIRQIIDLNLLEEEFPFVVVNGSQEGCYLWHYRNDGWVQNPYDEQKNFGWNFVYKKALFHKYKTTVTMRNYELKNGKWKKVFERCAIGMYSDLYSYWYDTENCYDVNDYEIALNNDKWRRSRSRTSYTNRVFTEEDTTSLSIMGIHLRNIEKQSYHINPEESYVLCLYRGNEYRINVSTGIQE